VSLSALLDEVRAFAEGKVSLKDLQRAWLPELIAPAPAEIPDPEAATASADFALFWQLVWLFESGADEARHREHARRIMACMDQTASATTTVALLRLIVDQDRFCGVVSKHLAGAVSLTGLRSVISESRYDPVVKKWLTVASPSAIMELGENLQGEHYAAVGELISRPPA
jgi:hypothetical protein